MAAAGVLAQPGRDHFQHSHAMYSSHPQLPSYESSRSRDAPFSGSSRQNDGFKPSLPSISNLINLADGDKKSQQPTLTRPRLPSPTQLVNDSRPTSHPTQISPRFAPLEIRTRYASQEAESRPWSGVLPPPSHLRSDSVMSAASRSPTSPSIGSPFGSPHLSRESSDPSYFKRQCMTSNPAASPYAGSQYGSPASYTSSPEMSSARSLHPHPDSVIQPPPPSVGGLYGQRPLPGQYPTGAGAPPSTASSRSTPMSPAENPYQHHHYLGASAQSAFPQPQDRYLCPTCNKAFSRPSSLKIHMHSHTGEKPFRCPHRGCGKSFSVRSNMKRHERGCHSEIGSVSSV